MATVTIRAIAALVELKAGLRLEIGGYMLLLHQLMLAMCETARILEKATTAELPVFAHFCLELHLVAFHELFSLLVIDEVPLRLLDGCKLVIAFDASGP